MSSEQKLETLKERLRTVADIRGAAHVLGWDQSTYMPPGGAEARGRQLATLESLAHEKFIDPEVGRLLDALAPLEADLPYDSDDASLLRVARRDFEKASKVPSKFLATFSEHVAKSYGLWAEARPDNDFAKVSAALQTTLDYSRELSQFFPGFDHIADPLIDNADEGTTVAALRPLFADLRAELVPIVEKISAQGETDESVLKGHFPEAEQLAFGLKLAKAFGYDLKRGRQDKTLHPFAVNFSVNDVRITTRVKEDDVSECLSSTLHEAGHAMYEQGISQSLEGTLLANGTSSGIHESQSRLWENQVGRSRGFWEHTFPKLQKTFPDLENVALDDFYRAINKVSRSLIRTDADEVTYNLHVIIRFDLELALLEGNLAVKDLPEAWRERYRSDLGIASENDTNGVLQDVHWFAGTVGGAFQGYTLGNILSAQFYEAALSAHPSIPKEVGEGKFSTLHGWLKDNIYSHGRKFTSPELIERATGQGMTIQPYVNYLKAKYGELYNLGS